jgi:hypothetical protein
MPTAIEPAWSISAIGLGVTWKVSRDVNCGWAVRGTVGAKPKAEGIQLGYAGAGRID